jgi:rare lipoprotein A
MLSPVCPFLALALVACTPALAGPRPEGPPPPSGGYVQRGEAAWYGGRFHGRLTASGERFDMHALTAAHRTLPFGTRVRVENLRNGRSVVVRITDRGPFTPRRIIDLSRGAAEQLDMIRSGVAPVRLQVLTWGKGKRRRPPPPPPPPPPPAAEGAEAAIIPPPAPVE